MRCPSSGSKAWTATSTSCKACCATRTWPRTASDTAFVEQHAAALLSPATSHRRRHAPHQAAVRAAQQVQHAPAGTMPAPSPMAGSVVSIAVAVGDEVRAGQQLAVLEAMKMEHLVLAPSSGIVRRIDVWPGQVAAAGAALCHIAPSQAAASRSRAGCRARPRPGPPRPAEMRSSAMQSASMRSAPTRSPVGARPASGPRGKTSRTWWTTAACANTARSRSPPSAGGGPWTN